MTKGIAPIFIPAPGIPHGHLTSYTFRLLMQFRPSDRSTLQTFLESEHSHLVTDAIVELIEGWDQQNDPIDEYSLARIGRWFAKYAKMETIIPIGVWLSLPPTPAKNAFLEGMFE